jgi:NAD(P)-dependent dehydrogenase (short-subunit alcohol dehydrogenase family)
MSEFEGKVVMVTGGGSGIGQGAALLFARDGAQVVVIDWDPVGGQETLGLIHNQCGKAIFINADVSRKQDVEQAVQTVVEAFGRIDVLISNAAVQINKPAVETTEEEWDRLHTVNLKGAFLCCRAVIPVMQKQRSGNIVITSSGHAFVTYPSCSVYAATKGGLLAFMRGLALDYAPDGIRVNCLVPGATDTAIMRKYLSECPDPEAERQKFINMIPMKRLGTPSDCAKAIRFLASDDASYITGTWLSVDGGLLAHG